MGRTIPLDGPALAFARERFREYYRAHPVPTPIRFTRREFAAFPFTTQTLMRRHESFATAEELRDFLVREPPRHVYYSSAYYREPRAAKMAEKEWLGADLVFDLDSDHLRDAAGLDYAAQLRLVKTKFRELLDEFLFGDFGISPELTTLVFSGGRGYHAHVHEPALLELTSPERRELVEYVLGTGLDARQLVRASIETGEGSYALEPGGRGRGDGGGAGRTVRGRRFERLPAPGDPGWGGRVTRSLQRLLERWEAEGAPVAEREMVAMGITSRKARRLARELVDEGKGRQIRVKLALDVFDRIPEEFLEVVLRRAAVEVQGETDAPVTTDIHRLIRLPGSLHGGTGFRVVPLRRDELDGFEPLRDAPWPVDGAGTPVEVTLVSDVDVPFPADPVRGREGDRLELPRSRALFLLLRGEATLGAAEPPREPSPAPPP